MSDVALTSEVLAIDPVALTDNLPFIDYKNGVLHIDGVGADTLASTYGTPCYVYSNNAIKKAYQAYVDGFGDLPHQVCYAVKANSNLAVLKTLAELGAGFDIVSKGELARVLQVTDGKKVVYSGIGKTANDIEFALNADIACFNVEATSELDLISQVAVSLNKTARISIRVNPDVDAKTHPYISTGLKDNKFGIDHSLAVATYQYAKSLPNIEIVGIDCHIGSQLLETRPFVDALHRVAGLIDELKAVGISLQHLDIGGGLGVQYTTETAPSVGEYIDAMRPLLQKIGLKVYCEPGRNIVANAGVLLTSVDVLKQTPYQNFAIVDASMSELIRPALYGSAMAVVPSDLNAKREIATWQVVGAVCESSDFLAKNRTLGVAVGDVLAITGAGAYGFVMASNYNSRPRPCEILCDKGEHKVIRKRERLDDLWALESV